MIMTGRAAHDDDLSWRIHDNDAHDGDFFDHHDRAAGLPLSGIIVANGPLAIHNRSFRSFGHPSGFKIQTKRTLLGHIVLDTKCS
jgi:hypothetical protein